MVRIEAQFLSKHTNTDGVIEYDGAICGALEGVTGLQSSKNQVFIIGAVGRKARGLESMSHCSNRIVQLLCYLSATRLLKLNVFLH